MKNATKYVSLALSMVGQALAQESEQNEEEQQ